MKTPRHGWSKARAADTAVLLLRLPLEATRHGTAIVQKGHPLAARRAHPAVHLTLIDLGITR
jgi:hypothetical protein